MPVGGAGGWIAAGTVGCGPEGCFGCGGFAPVGVPLSGLETTCCFGADGDCGCDGADPPPSPRVNASPKMPPG